MPNGDDTYLFFGAQREDQDDGRGNHAIGIATTRGVEVSSGPLPRELRFDFMQIPQGQQLPVSTGWRDLQSPNHTGLSAAGVVTTRWDPATATQVDGWFTPIVARIAQRGGGFNSRFANMAGVYLDGYFYLFVGLGATATLELPDRRGAIGIRIPFDYDEPYGIGRNTNGSIRVELWYIDADHPAGAYHPIDSTNPIKFSDDELTLPSGPSLPPTPETPANPNVPVQDALLRVSGSSPVQWVYFPQGLFQYPVAGTAQSYWMTSARAFVLDGPILVHRLVYHADDRNNPFRISTPYSIDHSGQTPCVPSGACNLPEIYRPRPAALLYPSSTAGTAIGYFDVDLNSCALESYGGSGPLPFSVSGFNPTMTGPIPPTNLTATASETAASLTWVPGSGTFSTEVWRSADGGSFELKDTVSGSAFVDTGLSTEKTYVYKVRGLDFQGFESTFSNVDIATTVAFTDDPLIATSTLVGRIHIEEIRAAVNLVRAAAGLSEAAFTDTTLIGESTTVKAIHMKELRDALIAARERIGLPAAKFTDANLTAQQTMIRAVHLSELRLAVK